MKKPFDFIAHRKIFLLISLGIILVGIVCNILMPVELDITFKGGTLLKYSYTGTIDKPKVDTLVDDTLKKDAVVEVTENDLSGTNILSVSLTDTILPEQQDELKAALLEAFPDNKIEGISANALEAAMGHKFLIKCLVAVGLASVFLVIYVGLRFRKIGGLSAGVMAVLALFNDLLVAYFAFVIFRIPLNDNFVAVLLSILGYSLNDTIVIYDRIRENRTLMGSKASIGEVVNTSLNQSFARTCNTSLCTLFAIGTVAVLALAMNLDSIVSFAVPMMFGVISGFYTSVCLCSPVWVLWKERQEKRELEKKSAAKSGKKSAKSQKAK